MTIQLRIMLICALFITTILLVAQIKRRKIELQYSISWMFLLFVLLIVCIFPAILDVLSHVLGIELAINMVFFLGFIFTLLIIYSLTKAVSKMSKEITELTQKVALMDKKMKEDEKNELHSK